MKREQAPPSRQQGFINLLQVAPFLYYTISSGLMMRQMQTEAPNCGFQQKANGETVDVDKKWLTMAKLCFSTSLIMTVLVFLSSVCTIIKPDNKFNKTINGLSSCAGVAFVANCFVIPLCIFAQFSKPCLGVTMDANNQPVEGVYEKYYKGFKSIWICMLALSLGLFVLIALTFCCLMCGAACLTCCMAKKAAESVNEAAQQANLQA